jgi:alpha-ribazole phosphatase
MKLILEEKMHFLKKPLFVLSALFCLGAAQDLAAEKTTILYVRHGEVPGNNPSPETYIYTGNAVDFSLTEKGQEQSNDCAEHISHLQKNGTIDKVTAIYSSTLTRALETATPIAKKLKLTVEPRYNLREIYWGSADGQLVYKMSEKWDEADEQVKKLYPDRKTRWDHLPVFDGAETYNELLNRCTNELKAISGTHPGETVIVVSHGRVFKTLVANALDTEKGIPNLANCGIAEFIYSDEDGLQFVKIIE